LPLKIDLHVHTVYSPDSVITPEQLVVFSKRRGLDGVAVTDHDRLDSALRIRDKTDFLVLPGIEVTSLNGHIVGLDVQEKVPKGHSAEETVDLIHDAGGIAIACHPTGFFKGSLGKYTSSKFDAVEVINSSAFPFRYTVKQSRKLASRLGIACVAGTDAHYAPEIGCAYTLIEAEPHTVDIMHAIKNGRCQPCGGSIPIHLRLKREFSVFFKRPQFEEL